MPKLRSSPVGPSSKSRPRAGLIPLFYAALLFISGVVLARFEYLRPAYLLIAIGSLVLVALLAIFGAPRLRWLPIALIWAVLGAWSAETELDPAVSPAVAALSDGLLREVEGTVAEVGPVHEADADDEAHLGKELDGSKPTEAESALRPAREAILESTIQRIDLELDSAEVVTDFQDALVPVPDSSLASHRERIRLSVLAGASQKGETVLPDLTAAVKCGQRIHAFIRMLPPETYHDPGVWNRASWLETQQISALATVKANGPKGDSPVRLQVLDSARTGSVACRLNELRNSASASLASLPERTRWLPSTLRATPADAAMLAALLTGDRTGLTRGLRAGFERTGSFHLIVVSGLHLAILAGCVLALCRRLRMPRLPATAVTLALTLAYAIFTGFAIPAQRSFWMIALYLTGRLLFRNRSPLNAIGFASLALAAVSPRSIFDASLQMTLISVTAIAGIAVPLMERSLSPYVRATQKLGRIDIDPGLSPEVAQFRVTFRLLQEHLETATNRFLSRGLFPACVRTGLRLVELTLITMMVELALALPMATYFHRITVYALPVNLIILPLLGLLVPAAMLMLVTLAVAPFLSGIFAAVTLGILHLSLFVVRGPGSWSWSDLRVPDPTRIQTVVAYFFFLLALLLARNALPKLSRQSLLAFLTLLFMAGSALWPREVDHPRDALLFEAIDVGQGDSLLLISPDGKTLLVDGGGIGFSSQAAPGHGEHFDIGEEVVSEALWSRGIRRLDAVALTHGHHDHMGGLPAILRNFRPRELWVGKNPGVPEYLHLLEDAKSLGITVRSWHAGQSATLGKVHLQILAPSSGYQPGPQPVNDDSLVMRAAYGQTSILLTGDAEAPEENSMLASGEGISSTILKVGHHGSLTSTRPQFLAQVAPLWAVISCGKRNRFGHPREEILLELQAAHVRTFRTDLDGATCLLLGGKPERGIGTGSVIPDPMCSGRTW